MRWPVLRDVTLFFGGMAGVLHETLLSHAERPTLLILFAAMMGLPAFLQGSGEHEGEISERVMRPGRHSAEHQRRERAKQEREDIAAEVERVLRERRELGK